MITLKSECRYLFALSGADCYMAPSKGVADRVVDEAVAIARYALERGVSQILIYWEGCGDRPYRIDAALASLLSSPVGVLPSSREVGGEAVSEDLDWVAVMGGANPIYISILEDQRNVFMNNAAVECQGIKPQEFLGDRAYALNYSDELSSRCGYITRDGGLREYHYEALRWVMVEGLPRRKLMRFTSNFLKIKYLSQPCWMGEVLQSEDIGVIY